MTRAEFIAKMSKYGFRMIFDSCAELVWKKGKNQVELFIATEDSDKVLLSRGCPIVVTIPLESLADIYMDEHVYPDTLTFSLTNGTTVDIDPIH